MDNNLQNPKSKMQKTKDILNKEFTKADLPNIVIDKEPLKKKMLDFHNKITQEGNTNKDNTISEDLLNQNDTDDINSNKFQIKVPNYLKDVYTWAYLNPKNVKLLDRNLVVHILLFLNASRLIKSYLKEVTPGSRMLQIAHVYGDMISRLAKKIGDYGQLDLIDVAKIQLAHAYKKLKNFKNIDMWQQDATVAYHRDYDIVGSFFLLHEVPMKAKIAIINNMLQQVEKNNAKAVFIDYHQPHTFHPLKPIMILVNTFLEPFANELWDFEIEALAKEAHKFKWEKTTYFGKMYQKVVVSKK